MDLILKNFLENALKVCLVNIHQKSI